MIPRANITAWRATAPWPDNSQIEQSMAGKTEDALFLADSYPLLRPGLDYDVKIAWHLVRESLISHLPGDPWKGT